ncbi:MAG: hypothetical protein EA411_02150 [Saprospirales bacterium]|nr:MAG: hypothetical protein EA411_02150 [Saprospirales bacterium]
MIPYSRGIKRCCYSETRIRSIGQYRAGLLVLLLLCSIAHSLSAQNPREVNFDFEWQVGDVRIIHFETATEETEEEGEKTTHFSKREITIEVIKDRPDGYLIRATLLNPFIQDIADHLGKTPEWSLRDEHIEVTLSISRFKSEIRPQNGEEVILKMRKSREEILRQIPAENELAYLFPLITASTGPAFQTIGGIGEYFDEKFRFLLLPLRHNFITDSTIIVSGTRQNPIELNMTDPYTTKFHLEKTAEGKYLLHEQTESDLADFASYVDQMQGLNQTDTLDGDSPEENATTTATFKTNSLTLFDPESGWVKEAQSTTQIEFDNPHLSSFKTTVQEFIRLSKPAN